MYKCSVYFRFPPFAKLLGIQEGEAGTVIKFGR